MDVLACSLDSRSLCGDTHYNDVIHYVGKENSANTCTLNELHIENHSAERAVAGLGYKYDILPTY